MKVKPFARCPGSGNVQMLSFMPDGDYPGAVVCLGCTYGVLVVKRSAHEATSVAGYEGMAGRVRAHDVRYEFDEDMQRWEPTGMRYVS